MYELYGQPFNYFLTAFLSIFIATDTMLASIYGTLITRQVWFHKYYTFDVKQRVQKYKQVHQKRKVPFFGHLQKSCLFTLLSSLLSLHSSSHLRPRCPSVICRYRIFPVFPSLSDQYRSSLRSPLSLNLGVP